MLQKNRLKISFTSIALLLSLTIALYIILENNWLYSLIESVLAPVFIVCITLLVSKLYLLLFNQTIQQPWWRWARLALIIPFLIIWLLLPTYENGGGFISFGGTTELVILWGVVFVAATIIHTLYQRFWLRIGSK